MISLRLSLSRSIEVSAQRKAPLRCVSFMTGHFGTCVLCMETDYIFHFNYWLICQRQCRFYGDFQFSLSCPTATDRRAVLMTHSRCCYCFSSHSALCLHIQRSNPGLINNRRVGRPILGYSLLSLMIYMRISRTAGRRSRGWSNMNI